MRFFLGVDLGTGGLKATLLDEAGTVRAEPEVPYQMAAPRPGWAEMEPSAWLAALGTARGELSGAAPGVEPAGIGFAGQMHGVVLVDALGAPVRPALLWPDQRGSEVLSDWEGLPAEVRSRLGNPMASGMMGPSLTWLARNEPETLAATTTVVAPKDWLRSQLTGDRVTERSDASATLLWDVVADAWSAPAVQLAGLDVDQLPEVRGSAAVVGVTDSIPVAACGADVACTMTALESVDPAAWPGATCIVVGSGIQVLRPGASAQPRVDPATHLFADTVGGWYEMVGVRNGGLSLSWVQRVLRLSWRELVAAAQAARSSQVVFVPFLTGERGHVAPATPRAGWLGATEQTGVAERARSAFEALAFNVRRSTQLLGRLDGPVLLTGGAAREPYLRQLLADCLRCQLTYVPLRSAAAVGAAVLVGRAVGTDLRPAIQPVDVVPRSDHLLESAFARWQDAVAAMPVTATPGPDLA